MTLGWDDIRCIECRVWKDYEFFGSRIVTGYINPVPYKTCKICRDKAKAERDANRVLRKDQERLEILRHTY